MASDLRLRRRRFDSRPFRFQITTLGKLFTHAYVPLFIKQYKLVPGQGRRRSAAGRVTAGLEET